MIMEGTLEANKYDNYLKKQEIYFYNYSKSPIDQS